MNREQAFATWAPNNCRWSEWGKPVLFSFMSDTMPDSAAVTIPQWEVHLSGDTALIVELPGDESVVAGVRLARFGFRPIPLFNASPSESETGGIGFSLGGLPALVDVKSIVRALERNTTALASIDLPNSAPPAFLLDARRCSGPLFPGSGFFDNRSIVRESDFPSSSRLKAEGIRRIILVRSDEALRRDLHPILLQWQNDGLEIQWQRYGEPWNPECLTIRRRNAISVFVEKVLMALSFKMSSLGAFRSTIHSAGG